MYHIEAIGVCPLDQLRPFDQVVSVIPNGSIIYKLVSSFLVTVSAGFDSEVKIRTSFDTNGDLISYFFLPSSGVSFSIAVSLFLSTAVFCSIFDAMVFLLSLLKIILKILSSSTCSMPPWCPHGSYAYDRNHKNSGLFFLNEGANFLIIMRMHCLCNAPR